MSQPLAFVRPSTARRVVGVGVQWVVGLALLRIAVLMPPADSGWRLGVVLLALVALAAGEWLRRATGATLILTAETLSDSSGRVLTPVAGIASVGSGVFALKPSNGFILTLAGPAPTAWAPGLWWRLGNRLGVGGVTNGRETRVMAEVITAMIAARG